MFSTFDKYTICCVTRSSRNGLNEMDPDGLSDRYQFDIKLHLTSHEKGYWFLTCYYILASPIQEQLWVCKPTNEIHVRPFPSTETICDQWLTSTCTSNASFIYCLLSSLHLYSQWRIQARWRREGTLTITSSCSETCQISQCRNQKCILSRYQ